MFGDGVIGKQNQVVCMDLSGKNVLVTGSAKRVGREISHRLAESGANVGVTYRTSESEAEDTVEELRGMKVEAEKFHVDLGDVDDIVGLMDSFEDRFGGIDALVNNASVFFPTPFGEVSQEDWDLTLDVNLRAPYFCSQEAADRMERGKIVNIADWSGYRPYTQYLPYCISKAGVIALTKGLAKELAPDINVNAIAPGPVMLPPEYGEEERREIIENTPLERIGSPRDIAEGVAFMMEGSDFVTGTVLPIDGGRLID